MPGDFWEQNGVVEFVSLGNVIDVVERAEDEGAKKGSRWMVRYILYMLLSPKAVKGKHCSGEGNGCLENGRKTRT